MTDPIYQDLNDEQAAAVAHGTGPLMVLAGAGSGKTRVVTRRIARLLRDGVRPGQILAMTFTNKAAGEMGRRVEELGGGYVRVATFHSACARFLRQDGHLLGYPPDFSIYDTQDRDTLLRELLEDAGIRPLILAEVDDMAMLRLLARESGALTLVPLVVVQDELRAGHLAERHRLPQVTENFYAITTSRRFPNPLLREMLDRRKPRAPG